LLLRAHSWAAVDSQCPHGKGGGWVGSELRASAIFVRPASMDSLTLVECQRVTSGQLVCCACFCYVLGRVRLRDTVGTEPGIASRLTFTGEVLHGKLERTYPTGVLPDAVAVAAPRCSALHGRCHAN
jgi:hypothetical protein